MNRRGKRFVRKLHGKRVEGIAMEIPDEIKTPIHERQPDSVAMLVCPVCLAKRYVNQAYFDFGQEAKQVAVDGVPTDYKEAARELAMLPRHKPCDAIMQVHMLPGDEERKPTTERLAEALEAAGAPSDMIEKAQAGYYDDFKSDSPFPLVLLAMDAHKAGLGPEFHQRIVDGEFDAQKWESDAWAKSPDGQATFGEFMRQVESRPNRKERRKKGHGSGHQA
jgi:hypothetical protein